MIILSRKVSYLVAGIMIVAALGVVAVALPDLNRVTLSTSTVRLPAGCVKPVGGFLIVASLQGFNGSALAPHAVSGVPQDQWPVMNVKAGQNVTIIVCNADSSQAHGFQIEHYYSNNLVSLAPGQVLRVSFIASQAGTFRVYCQILCSVHWAMQNGQLVVN